MLKIQFQKRNLLQKEIDAENDESSKFKKRILKKNVSRNPISSDEEVNILFYNSDFNFLLL